MVCRMKRALYLGIHDSNYPRNRDLRLELQRRGWSVDAISIQASEGFAHNYRYLAEEVARRKRQKYQLVVLSEFSLEFSPIAKSAAVFYRCRLIVDFFVGLYETRVEDMKKYGTKSLKAVSFKILDRIAYTVADSGLIDTKYRAEQLNARHRRSKVVAFPVGAPAWARPPGHSGNRSTDATTVGTRAVSVLYYGTFLPLHGVDMLVRAVTHTTHVQKLTLVGDGPERQRVQETADRIRSKLKCEICWVDPVSESELRGLIADHDLVAGIFGSSSKAFGVIPNKVWQAVCSGKMVVTRYSPALEEITSIAPTLICSVKNPSEIEIARALDLVQIPSSDQAAASAFRLREAVELERNRALGKVNL